MTVTQSVLEGGGAVEVLGGVLLAGLVDAALIRCDVIMKRRVVMSEPLTQTSGGG